MPRKPKSNPTDRSKAVADDAAAMDAASAGTQEAELSAQPLGPNEKPKNWGPPYKTIYRNLELGFELGEDRRFKQRVFKFRDKPDEQTRQTLKDAGFRYRPEDHAWTVQADAVTRELSDRLAQELAGEDQGRGR